MTLVSEIFDLLEQAEVSFPWDLKREEFVDLAKNGERFQVPTHWLRDPDLVLGREEGANTLDNISDPVKIGITPEKKLIVSDGTHLVMVSDRLDRTHIPATFSSDFINKDGYEVLVRYAFDQGTTIPMEVLAQFDWTR